MGFRVDEEKNVGGWVCVDGLGIVDELVYFTAHARGLELEVENEVDRVEDFLVGVETLGAGYVIELVLDACF